MKKRYEIERISNHTIKKIELISSYTKDWAIKLLNYRNCSKIVFIDCMANCGHYLDNEGNIIEGTALRVAKALRDISFSYPNKKIDLFFNDISGEKIDYLKELLPKTNDSFVIKLFKKDANLLLKEIAKEPATHYLLIYDPYEASIDWEAIYSFLNSWSEVIINHMVVDSARGIKNAKNEERISKYKNTYLVNEIEDLLSQGNTKDDYENRIEQIIKILSSKKKNVFIASFPFFNEKNSVVYNLIQCTNSLEGFKLFKKKAWDTFGGKSSSKNTKGKEDQLTLDFEGKGYNVPMADEHCYYIKDVADYLQEKFGSQKNVLLDDVWSVLDKHPVFPSDGYKKEIKEALKRIHNVTFNKNTVSFMKRTK